MTGHYIENSSHRQDIKGGTFLDRKLKTGHFIDRTLKTVHSYTGNLRQDILNTRQFIENTLHRQDITKKRHFIN